MLSNGSAEIYISSRLTTLLDIMKRFNAHRLMNRCSLLGFMSGAYAAGAPLRSSPFMMDAHRAWWRSIFESIEKECTEVELSTTQKAMRHILVLLDTPDCRYSDFDELSSSAGRVLLDEMESTVCFRLTKKEAELFDKSFLGWENIVARLPECISDIEQASKCFALSCYTASVFHILQVVDFGSIELGKFLDVNDPLPGFSATEKALKKVLLKPHQERTDFEKQNFAFLEQIQSTLEAIKNSWRNKVSHAHGKLILMGKDFPEYMAEEIYFAARSFMRRLADGLPPSVAA